MGHLSDKQMNDVNSAISVSFGLSIDKKDDITPSGTPSVPPQIVATIPNTATI